MNLLSACGGSRDARSGWFSGLLLRYLLRSIVVRNCGDTDDSVLPILSARIRHLMSETVSIYRANEPVYQRAYRAFGSSPLDGAELHSLFMFAGRPRDPIRTRSGGPSGRPDPA